MSESSVHPSPAPSPEGVKLVQASTEPESQHVNEATVSSNPDAVSADYHAPPKTLIGETAKYLISVSILALGAAVAFGLSLLKEPPPTQNTKLLVPMVKTIEAAPYAGQLDKIISGTVVPYREIRVAAEVSGNVVKKYDDFEAGNFVNKGDKLLEIDPTDYQLMLETGKAEVEQSQKMLEETEQEIIGAQRNIKLAETEYQLALDEYDRNTKIKRALSSTELDQSKRNLLSAETGLTTRRNTLDMLNARVKRMEAALTLAQAQLNRTQLNLDKTTIVAPDDGVIVREMVQEGDYVRAGDPLVTFEDTSRSEVICHLTPTDLAWVRSNAPASSEFDSDSEGSESDQFRSVYYLPKTKVSVYETGNPSVVWEGILERFDGIGRDESTRTIPCRVTIKNPIIETELGPRALVRGMYVKCKIQVQTSADKSKRSFLSLPAVAVHPGNVVWVVRNPETDPRLEQLKVEVVDYAEQLVDDEVKKIVVISEDKDSVRAGDLVVRSPLSQPSNQAEVILENGSNRGTAVTTAAKNEDVESSTQ